MRASRIAGGLIAVAACAALIVALPIAVRRAEGRYGRFPDGTVVHLEDFSYDKEHVLKRHGDAWWQLFLPPKEVARQRCDTDTLGLWLHVSRGARQATPATLPAGAPATTALLSDWWDWAEIVDDCGDTIRTVNNDRPYVRIVSNTSPLQVVTYPIGKAEYDWVRLSDYPRRGKTVTLRLYVYGRKEPCAQFTMPNPTPGAYPRWTPQPPPITQRQGDLTASLVSLTPSDTITARRTPNSYASFPIDGRTLDLQPGETRSTQALFRLIERGKPTTAWQVAGIPFFFDATGNRYASTGCYGVRSGEVGVALQFPACEPEPVKMRVALMRTVDATFPPDAIYAVPNVLLAKPGTFAPSSASVRYKGYTIRILGTSGTGHALYPPPPGCPNRRGYMGWAYSDAPGLRIQISPSDRRLCIFLKGVDDRGRPVAEFLSNWDKPHPWLLYANLSHGFTNGQTDYFSSRSPSYGGESSVSVDESSAKANIDTETFFLKVPPGAKSLNLTLGMNEIHAFDFLIPGSTHP